AYTIAGDLGLNRTRVNPPSQEELTSSALCTELSLSHLRSPYYWQGRSINGIEINSVPPIRCP
ncbi:hypothetical protein PIB30_080966, partial [Stylosanthes scabra]|nr:hypothetical protein [Stylosanthes scabra]